MIKDILRNSNTSMLRILAQTTMHRLGLVLQEHRLKTVVSSLCLVDFIQSDGCKPQVLPRVLESMLQHHPWVACEARRPTEPVDPVTPADPMCCLATVAQGSQVTPAVASPVAMADASPKTLIYMSPATMANESPETAADESPTTVAVQSRESQCQQPVLW